MLLPVEVENDSWEWPTCDAVWHLGAIPIRCGLPMHHPDMGNVPGWSSGGHFYLDPNFADWAEVEPWNAAWSDVHHAFQHVAFRELEIEHVLACLRDWAGGPPAPTIPKFWTDAVLSRANLRMKHYGRGMPRWDWLPAWPREVAA